MTISFAGGEIGAFIPSDSNVTESTSIPFNSSFARCGIRVSRNTTYAESAHFTAIPDCYVHADACPANDGFFADANGILVFYDDADVPFVRLYANAGTSATWQMQYWNGAAWTNAGSSITIAAVVIPQSIDINVISNTASGEIRLYVAGTKRIEATGIDLSSFNGVSYVRPYGRPAGSSSDSWSQIIVADEPTIGWRLKTVPATGAGATTDMTGGYTEIDEIVYDDTDFVNSASANQVELFAHSTTIPAGYTVRAFVVTARAKCGASGPQNLQLALRSAGTTYFSSSKALDVGYGAFINIWETDPATSSAFTASAASAVQFGVKSIT